MAATTKDVGIFIRDMCEGRAIDVQDWEGDGPADGEQEQHHIDVIDVSDASNPIVFLDNGQRFQICIFAI